MVGDIASKIGWDSPSPAWAPAGGAGSVAMPTKAMAAPARSTPEDQRGTNGQRRSRVAVRWRTAGVKLLFSSAVAEPPDGARRVVGIWRYSVGQVGAADVDHAGH